MLVIEVYAFLAAVQAKVPDVELKEAESLGGKVLHNHFT